MKVRRSSVVTDLHLLVHKGGKLVWVPDDQREEAEALSCKVGHFPYTVVETSAGFRLIGGFDSVSSFASQKHGCSNGRLASDFDKIVIKAERAEAMRLLGSHSERSW